MMTNSLPGFDDDFKLEPSTRQSAAWFVLKRYFERELDALRRRNDGALDAIQTAELRGQIKVFKRLLALEEDALPTDSASFAGHG